MVGLYRCGRALSAPATLLAAVLLATPAAAVQLVANGGFESGDFAGWTRFGGLNQTNVNAADAVTGAFGARFSPNSPGGIRQDVATLAGASYVISFDLQHFANLAVPNNGFSIEFGGITLVSISNAATLPLTHYSFTPVAGSALSQLKLTFRDNRNSPANRWSIDNISVTPSNRTAGAVPEPATWALLFGGFALIGAAARRRRAPASIRAAVETR